MIRRLQRGLLLIVASLCLATPAIASAYSSGTYGSSTYGSCQYGSVCSITLSTNTTINLNVIPTVSGSCTIQSDTISVLTDDANGYTLSLTNSSTNTALVNGGSSIAATSGTFASPVALTANTWGYRIDGVGNFGSGPTTAQTNVAPGSLKFAGVVASNASADTIGSSGTAADPAVTETVWYGVCATVSKTSGTYTTQVTYTGVAN